mmetsp:Transcript_9576/g.30559  ORF Transcript_9576/g.30559 Transcript_9576/m.30559 type:complete len:222 (-) Transcript_9576:98-763(-)
MECSCLIAASINELTAALLELFEYLVGQPAFLEKDELETGVPDHIFDAVGAGLLSLKLRDAEAGAAFGVQNDTALGRISSTLRCLDLTVRGQLSGCSSPHADRLQLNGPVLLHTVKVAIEWSAQCALERELTTGDEEAITVRPVTAKAVEPMLDEHVLNRPLSSRARLGRLRRLLPDSSARARPLPLLPQRLGQPRDARFRPNAAGFRVRHGGLLTVLVAA